MPLRLLGLFAHPDDESFLCGGTLARYSRAGIDTMVVSVTRGERGPIRTPDSVSRGDLPAVRAREWQAAGRLLGIDQLVLLDYPDGELEGLDPGILEGIFLDLLRSFQPHVVLTFDADGLYRHPDHIAVHRAAVEAFFASRSENGGSAALPAKLYYATWPRQQLRRAIGTLRAQEVETSFIPDLPQCGTPDSSVTSVIDVAAHVADKVAAVKAHRSQVDPSFQSLRPDQLRDLWSREYFVRAHPRPWVSGVVERDLFAGLARQRDRGRAFADSERLAG